MNIIREMRFILLVAILFSFVESTWTATNQSALIEVARFENQQVTGVAVSKSGRIFVNFPRWSDALKLSVAELRGKDSLIPFPNAEWNEWNSQKDPTNHFVCVQSVYVDDRDHLWILDPASPRFEGVVKGGAKLIEVDLEKNALLRTIHFSDEAAPQRSYLNDVRVDTKTKMAYLTDSGLGAIVVVNLDNEKIRRVLTSHPSTQSDAGFELEVQGRKVRSADGKTPQIHADGIALDSKNGFLYYHALTATNLFQIPVRVLNDFSLPEEELGRYVEKIASTGPCDGMWIDESGTVYLTALQENGIQSYSPTGGLQTLLTAPELSWPDSLAMGPDKFLYVTTSRIHQMPRFNDGTDRRNGPYAVFKVRLK